MATKEEKHGDGHERHRIRGFDFDEQACQHTCQCERGEQTDRDADCAEEIPFPTINRKIRDGAAPRPCARRSPRFAGGRRLQARHTTRRPQAALVENTPIGMSEKRVCAWAWTTRASIGNNSLINVSGPLDAPHHVQSQQAQRISISPQRPP